MDEADRIWNAACATHPASSLPGDVALHAALRIHSLTMSGGVLHAVEVLGEPALTNGENGYRWLGLDDVADLIASIRADVRDGVLDDDERAEMLEIRVDQHYQQLLPSDEHLEGAFRQRLTASPEAFSR